jgi:ATP synthase protein I
MNEVIARPARAVPTPTGFDDEVEQQEIKPLTPQEAQVVRNKNPSLSPWRVVAAQAIAGVSCALLAWAITGRVSVFWSALYGAAAAVLPSALLARGMTRNLGNTPGAAGTAMFRFMFWETVKIGVAVAMLLAAPRVVPGLSWPALLVAMVVCMKMNWLVLLWRRKPVVTEPTQRV